MKKKLLSILMAVALAVSTIGMPAFASEAETSSAADSYIFEKVASLNEMEDDAKYIIVGKGTDSDGNTAYYAMSQESYYASSPGRRFGVEVEMDENGDLLVPYSSKVLIMNFRETDITNTADAEAYPGYLTGKAYRLLAGKNSSGNITYLFALGDSNGNSWNYHYSLPIYTSTLAKTWWSVREVPDTDGQFIFGSPSTYGNIQSYGVRYSYTQTMTFANGYFQSLSNNVFLKTELTAEDGKDIYIYKLDCKHPDHTVTHYDAADVSCEQPGNIEYYYCSDCKKYATDREFTNIIELSDTHLTSYPHEFGDGDTCTVCGAAKYKDAFGNASDTASFNSWFAGKKFILVGKDDAGNYYVMGTQTEDGKRNAVRVTPNKYGNIETDSGEAAIMEYSYEAEAVLIDNGVLNLSGGKIAAIDVSRENNGGYYIRWYAEYDEAGRIYSAEGYQISFVPGDEETAPCFASLENGSAVNTYLYEVTCNHDNGLAYVPEIPATCVYCGLGDYWKCEDCEKIFSDDQGTLLSEIERYHATGHDYGETKCANCQRTIPVYSKITSKDQISTDASYIIVATDGTKTYVLRRSEDLYADLNNNGIADCEEIDLDGNGTPDIYETDSDGDGTPDIYDDDYAEINAIEVTPNDDGTITVPNLDAEEFEMLGWGYGAGEEVLPCDVVEDEIVEDENIEGDVYIENYDDYVFWGHNGYICGLNGYGLRSGCLFEGEKIADVDETCVWRIAFGNALTESELWCLGDARFEIADDNVIIYPAYMGYQADAPIRLRVYEGVCQFVAEIDDYLPGAEFEYDEEGNYVYDENGYAILHTNDSQYGVYLYGAPVEGVCDHAWDAGQVSREATCGSDGLKIFTCTACGETKSEVIKATGNHEFSEWTASETYEGHWRECRVCGCQESEMQHNYDAGNVLREATHTSEGLVTYTCETCGYEKQEILEKLDGHEFGDWTQSADGSYTHTRECACGEVETGECTFDEGVVAEAETCGADGLMVYTCEVCGGTRDEVIPATGNHAYNEGIEAISPTHTSEGVRVYTCEVCGDTYTETISKLEAHEFDDWMPSEDVSETHYRECTCGLTETGNCTFDDGMIVEEAVCGNDGLLVYTCTLCGATKEEVIPKLEGHEFGEWLPAEDGSSTHIRECACGAAETETCTFDEGVITREATCGQDGVKTFTCIVCGGTRTEIIPMSGEHTPVADEAIAATCTETGLTAGSHCSVCGEVIIAQEVIEAAGHSWKTVYTVDERATTARAGTKSIHCKVCGARKNKMTIAKIASVKLSYTKATYSGTVKRPAITVKDAKGTKITSYTYVIRNSSGTKVTKPTKIGVYKITLTFNGSYKGTKTLTYMILPKAVTGASAKLYTSKTNNQIRVSWSKTTGATGYRVYYKKSTVSTYSKYKDVTTSYATFTGLSNNTKYNFKIVPYYKSGTTKNLGIKSTYVSATTLKKVVGVKVSRSGKRVTVKWTNIPGETGYQISRSTKSTGIANIKTYKGSSLKSKTFSITLSKKYYYRVRAYKVVNGVKQYGPWSASVYR